MGGGFESVKVILPSEIKTITASEKKSASTETRKKVRRAS
jgi:hypothetical protein